MGARWEKIKADRPVTMRQWKIGAIALLYIGVYVLMVLIIKLLVSNAVIQVMMEAVCAALMLAGVEYVYRRRHPQ